MGKATDPPFALSSLLPGDFTSPSGPRVPAPVYQAVHGKRKHERADSAMQRCLVFVEVQRTAPPGGGGTRVAVHWMPIS